MECVLISGQFPLEQLKDGDATRRIFTCTAPSIARHTAPSIVHRPALSIARHLAPSIVRFEYHSSASPERLQKSLQD